MEMVKTEKAGRVFPPAFGISLTVACSSMAFSAVI
jgi:hypothetical protein